MTDRSATPLPLSDLIDDLVAEQQALDDVMSPLGDDDWATCLLYTSDAAAIA